MTDTNTLHPCSECREFLRSSASAAASTFGLSPAFAFAAPVPEEFHGSALNLKAEPSNSSGTGAAKAKAGDRPEGARRRGRTAS